MTLPLCPEPPELGGMSIEEIRQRLQDETLEYTKGQILSGFRSYLWTVCNWKTILREKGMSWPMFEKIISSFYADIKNCIHGGITWVELLDIIEKSRPIQKYLMQK
jgi:hypothetical protein